MVRVEIRYLVDMCMLVVFILCAMTGFVLWYAFPSGSGGGPGNGQGAVFLGVLKHDWILLHDASSLALTGTILIHTVINLPWILHMTKKLFGGAQP